MLSSVQLFSWRINVDCLEGAFESFLATARISADGVEELVEQVLPPLYLISESWGFVLSFVVQT